MHFSDSVFEAVTQELRDHDLLANINLDGCTGITALQHEGRNWLLLFARASILLLSLLTPGWSCSFLPSNCSRCFVVGWWPEVSAVYQNSHLQSPVLHAAVPGLGSF